MIGKKVRRFGCTIVSCFIVWLLLSDVGFGLDEKNTAGKRLCRERFVLRGQYQSIAQQLCVRVRLSSIRRSDSSSHFFSVRPPEYVSFVLDSRVLTARRSVGCTNRGWDGDKAK